MRPLEDPKTFILENTVAQPTPLVGEINLRVADQIVPIWQMTEEQLEEQGLPPPFWAFAWAGGQALSRYVLDNPDLVKGKRVLDFACGSGICAIAAALAGAAAVTANDVDPLACSAAEINAELNGMAVETISDDIVGQKDALWDVILAGDICYERPLADRVEAWLRAQATQGTLVLIGDPGRTYLPNQGVKKLVSYAVQTTRELEDNDVRNTSVWRVLVDA